MKIDVKIELLCMILAFFLSIIISAIIHIFVEFDDSAFWIILLFTYLFVFKYLRPKLYKCRWLTSQEEIKPKPITITWKTFLFGGIALVVLRMDNILYATHNNLAVFLIYFIGGGIAWCLLTYIQKSLIDWWNKRKV